MEKMQEAATVEQKVNALCAMVKTVGREASLISEQVSTQAAAPIAVEFALAATTGAIRMEALVIAIIGDSTRRKLFDDVWRDIAVYQREAAALPESLPPLPPVVSTKKPRGKKERKAVKD